MSKHTPGPWRVEHRCIYGKNGDYITRDIGSGSSDYVARMDASTMQAFDQKANAQLIASAPDLLDVAIKLLDDTLRHNDFATWCADRKLAREVIAKATGETP